jgi:DNA mismatch repair protein MutS
MCSTALVKPVKDTGNFIEPFREKCVQDQAFSRAVDAVGMIDELLSCHGFAGQMSHATTLPTVTDDAHHAFEASGLTNPILAKEKPECVPNDVKMNGTRLSFISGPNSGGKTTICKSIVQNQLLAQMGSYVLADKATINIADMIRYQAPKFDGLQDDEGRFGTELSRTRDIFYSTSPGVSSFWMNWPREPPMRSACTNLSGFCPISTRSAITRCLSRTTTHWWIVSWPKKRGNVS